MLYKAQCVATYLMGVGHKLHCGIVNNHFLKLDTWIQLRDLIKAKMR